MTLYLTEGSNPDDIEEGYKAGVITALKLYPAGATTNSDSGVRNFDNAMPALERMAELGIPMCVHGEVTDPEIDIFDREAVFIDKVLDPLRKRLPELRVVMEHITTEDGVEYVKANDKNLGATITTHHLIINRNAMLVGAFIRICTACRLQSVKASLGAACSGNIGRCTVFPRHGFSTAHRCAQNKPVRLCRYLYRQQHRAAFGPRV